MNPQNRNQIIVLVVLGLIFAGVVYKFVLSGGDQTKGGPFPGGKSGAPDLQASAKPGMEQPLDLKTVDIDPEALLRDIEVVPFDYKANQTQRDPMTPLIGQIKTGATLKPLAGPGSPGEVAQKKVTGIIWDEYNPMAVVDDEVVSLGHMYPNGVQVYSIEKDRVVFKVRDSLIPVPMKEL